MFDEVVDEPKLARNNHFTLRAHLFPDTALQEVGCGAGEIRGARAQHHSATPELFNPPGGMGDACGVFFSFLETYGCWFVFV